VIGCRRLINDFVEHVIEIIVFYGFHSSFLPLKKELTKDYGANIMNTFI